MDGRMARIIEGLDLSLSCKNVPIPNIFNGKESDCDAVFLGQCGIVEFIPIKVLQKFRNLKELAILFSKMIQVPKNLFTADLKMLQSLILCANKTEKIDIEAFTALTELKEITLRKNEIEEIPHKIFEKNLKLEKIVLSDNLIQLLHPELFDGLVNLKEVDLTNNLRFSKKIGEEKIPKLSEELKPLFDNYIKKYGKKPVQVANWQQKFEELQLVFESKGQKYEFLLKKYNQSKQELREALIQAELQDMRGTTSQDQSTDISSKLLRNYEKLQGIDGDIVLEFQDGKVLKAHKAILIGEFLNLFTTVLPRKQLSEYYSNSSAKNH
jgi:hypothetical protein